MKSVPMLSSAFLHPAGESLPEPLLALRKERASALVDMPLPTRKTENWKYSSKYLKLADDMAISLPAEGKTGNSLAVPGYKVVFINGVMIPEASEYPDLDGIEILSFNDLANDEAEALSAKLGSTLNHDQVQFARLNGARFEDGLFIRLKPGAVLDQPLFIIHETSADASGSAYPRIYVEAGANSQLTLVEEYTSSGEASALVSTVTEFSLADGANVTSIRLNMEGENVQHIGATGVLQQRSSRFESHCVGFGGPLRRHDLQVRLEGEGAETKLNGVVVTQGKQHYDNHTSIDHVAAHCNSEETYRNIAADQSHAVFNGRIHIHQDAQKSNADMNNKNLLLSNGAEIDTKPELEIYADDVKCAHGATIGQLDETSVFYLVSRGIGRRQANVLLTMAFINELVQQIPVEAVRETAQARLSDFFEQTFQEA
ncbi:MAG TPA: Fe-S cluster assembly protein SufD [Marinobacter hydrocarbonoclasticus]|uniref:Fe-S cluster assembly protein SufD n=1 Tax=Marinobacter TaxID=2742 RepID=UPI000C5007B7|nr:MULTISPECIES: Fe-S cluster assembly protein SufD [Marinobacter]MAC22089.1 Fe-S cluster assembly protein SufD [Marinobacter sp.]MBU41285.1 Fe-S cluster assembly protein SufD [Marinobacter sp.]HAX08470.1 Fe-S cluster assembly protein SufD [Marinobacter nauticus]HCL39689.1 Fe-S cluster assembly protein SufD [Marinobacter nauticus]HCR46757.1 Fe-S cluster assembly protein SufD [Marinobacter nauticus]